MSLPLFSSFLSALSEFTHSIATATYKPGDDSVVRAVQVTVAPESVEGKWPLLCAESTEPLFFQEVRLDLEKDLRSDAHTLASSLLADALLRHSWSIKQQLAVIDNVECRAESRGSEACVYAAFQSSMLEHMQGCFGFHPGGTSAPSISIRSLSVGSVSHTTAVDISRAFISGYIQKQSCINRFLTRLINCLQVFQRIHPVRIKRASFGI
jgi:hypothetical protein